jgi:hypothetical protein
MIHQMCHSPIVEAKYICDTLRDVCFEEIMSNHGMFFLHNLDLDCCCILGISDINLTTCKEAMSPSQNRIEAERDETRYIDFLDLSQWQSTNDTLSRSAIEVNVM